MLKSFSVFILLLDDFYWIGQTMTVLLAKGFNLNSVQGGVGTMRAVTAHEGSRCTLDPHPKEICIVDRRKNLIGKSCIKSGDQVQGS